jgi:hypothetical protein
MMLVELLRLIYNEMYESKSYQLMDIFMNDADCLSVAQLYIFVAALVSIECDRTE